MQRAPRINTGPELGLEWSHDGGLTDRGDAAGDHERVLGRLPDHLGQRRRDGQPVLGYFGTTQAFSDHQIAIWMRTPERGFLKRIEENPKATMLYRNTQTRMSFQIHVEAKRVDDESVKKQVWSTAAEVERNQDPEMKGTAVVAEIVRVVQRGEIIMERD